MLLGLFTPAIQLVNWRVSGCSVKRHQLQAMFTVMFQRSGAQWRCVLPFQYWYDFNQTSSLLMRSPPQHGSGKSPHRCQMWWACLCRQGAHQPRPTGQNFWQTLAIYGPMSLCATYTCKHFKKMRCTSLQVNRKQASLLMTPRLNQTQPKLCRCFSDFASTDWSEEQVTRQTLQNSSLKTWQWQMWQCKLESFKAIKMHSALVQSRDRHE